MRFKIKFYGFGLFFVDCFGDFAFFAFSNHVYFWEIGDYIRVFKPEPLVLEEFSDKRSIKG
jgi:hypothetical protein